MILHVEVEGNMKQMTEEEECRNVVILTLRAVCMMVASVARITQRLTKIRG
ncbi:MAG: hypothetical protein UT24_C0003G0045 [Candidatus Woesebacteria bacterium GW2011_GWB1_39_12]|uniref:Uncharacterized protein n=1 Tax=Candidatus Woesebacteria bacterium GW2011_GWB1_39_12 TaxID=1618574 RepID=A0A0G0MEN3_9BACT|nr:MAG: hypothetical protein UT24_C0003G0045 [Candidatus Woesebacteria bacterium GW2011_GWB1_39_12]